MKVVGLFYLKGYDWLIFSIILMSVHRFWWFEFFSSLYNNNNNNNIFRRTILKKKFQINWSLRINFCFLKVVILFFLFVLHSSISNMIINNNIYDLLNVQERITKHININLQCVQKIKFNLSVSSIHLLCSR